MSWEHSSSTPATTSADDCRRPCGYRPGGRRPSKNAGTRSKGNSPHGGRTPFAPCTRAGRGVVPGHAPGLPGKPREDADAEATHCITEALARAAMEAGAVLFWLLQPGIGARMRVGPRFWLTRASGAEYLDEAVQKIDPSAAGTYGETPAMVEAAIQSLGLNYTRQQNPRTRRWVWTCEGEKLPGYTARATSFEAAVRMTAAYAIYLAPRNCARAKFGRR